MDLQSLLAVSSPRRSIATPTDPCASLIHPLLCPAPPAQLRCVDDDEDILKSSYMKQTNHRLDVVNGIKVSWGTLEGTRMYNI